MMDATLISWVLAGIPLLGVLASLPFMADPGRLKWSSVVWALITLASIAGFAGRLEAPPEGLLPLCLLPAAAAISILGQPVHEPYRRSWVLTLLLLGLGLSALSSPPPFSSLSLTLLLGLIAGLVYRHHSALWPRSWWGIGAYALGALCAALSAIAEAPLSAVASLLACAVLLPLVPFHDGHLTALTRLPGSLPSFIVVLLPVIGLHGLGAAMTTVPDTVAWTVSFFALMLAVFFGLGMGPVMSAFATELFPTEIRGQAAAWIRNWFEIAGYVFGPALVGILGDHSSGAIGNIGDTVTLLMVLQIPTIFLVWRYMPETKGMELEDIADTQAQAIAVHA